MGNAGAKAAATAAGGAAEDGPGAAAEALLEGAEYDTETEDAAEASEAEAVVGVRPPRPSNWESMSKYQKKSGSNMEGGHVE